MSFLENFYGTLFSPDNTFDRLKADQPLLQAFSIVLIVSLINPIVNFNYAGAESFAWLGFGIISGVFSGLFSWLFVASFLDIVASIFKQSGKIKEFLVLSGFSLIPWLFTGPVGLFKTGGVPGNILGIIIGFGIWLWVTVLLFKSIMKAYNLPFVKVFVLILVPFLGSFLALSWFMNFISTFMQIIKV